MSDHAWVQQNLDAYALGGMSAEERESVAQHVAGCLECEHALDAIRQVEKLMDHVLADARPDAGLEDRVIGRLRRASRSRPGLYRFVMAAAAVLVLGVMGFTLQALVADDSGKKGPGAVAQNRPARFLFESNDETVKEGNKIGRADPDSIYFPDIAKKYDLDSPEEGKPYLKGRADDANEKTYVKGITGDELRLEIAQRNHGNNGLPVEIPPPSVNGKVGQRGAIETFADPRKNYPSIQLPTRDPIVATLKRTKESGYYEDGDKLKDLADAQKEIAKALEKAMKDDGKESKQPGNPSRIQYAPLFESPKMPWSLPSADSSKPNAADKNKGGEDGFYPKPGDKGEKAPVYFDRPVTPVTAKPPALEIPRPASSDPVLPPVRPSTPSPAGNPPPPPGEKDKGKDEKLPDGAPKNQEDANQKLPPAKVEPPEQPPPEPAQRKIIRSGEMEFEVDSFHAARDAVTNLLKAKTKGKGIVATVNSDQLANGKIRGSVVVRMPPEYLDDFLKDLRDALGKTGELKSERIGSQDVTKAYTDVESELRAARAIEDRFLNIIKSGKGEIKDLIAAERELGIWRTKIEKMEGEIRYYNNLIALSTLTIHLTEKQIQAATALVLRERVQMNIEVEDVDDGQKAVRAGVKAAKGRILKSEMKRADAGQVIADVHADIPPASAELFRELLRKLGTVTRHQVDRTQQAEGGVAGQKEIKEREEDVRFELSLYNTANIKPRETFNLKIASQDVAMAYRKLKDAIDKAKGQIRRANLDEQDKLDINADLDFNVSAADRAAIDKLILEQGFIIKRHTVQAAVNEMSTDRKVGYELKLRSVAAISPKEIFRYGLTVQDVQESYRLLFDEVTRVKGRIHKGHVDEQDRYNIRGELNFDIASVDKLAFDKFLKAAGLVALLSSDQAAPNIDSTDLKVGYRLMLRSIFSVPPREVLTISIATQDVAISQLQLHDEAAKLKARVHRTQLMEHDAFNVAAVFDFDVNIQDRPRVDKLLQSLGAVISRSNAQAGPKDDVTDQKVGYRLSLKNVNSIPPRDIYTIQIAAQDVVGAHLSLREEALALKARVLHTQLLEQDRFNVTAVFHFDVNAQDRAAVDKLLKALGVTLSRTNAQAGPKEDATDLKVGYRLTLRNVAGIPPRDIFQIHIASPEVAANHRRLLDEVTRLKGRILKTQLNEEDRFKVSAEFDFDIDAKDRGTIDKLIADAGATVSRTNAQAGPRDDATDLKVGYRLVLKNAAGAEPREKTALQIQVSDVNQQVVEFKSAVQGVKGRVIDSKFDRFESGKVEALIVFEVPLAAEDSLVKQFRAAGYVEKHQTSPNKNVPENELSTAHIIVKLTTAGPILPSDDGVGEQLRRGLYWAFRVFSWCLIFILTALAFVVPVVFTIWVAYKVICWTWPSQSAATIKTVSLAPAAEKPALKPEEPKPS